MVVGVVRVRLVGGHAGGMRVECAVGREDVHGCLGRMARDEGHGALRHCRLSLQMTVDMAGFIRWASGSKQRLVGHGVALKPYVSRLFEPQSIGCTWLPLGLLLRGTLTLWSLWPLTLAPFVG